MSVFRNFGTPKPAPGVKHVSKQSHPLVGSRMWIPQRPFHNFVQPHERGSFFQVGATAPESSGDQKSPEFHALDTSSPSGFHSNLILGAHGNVGGGGAGGAGN